MFVPMLTVYGIKNCNTMKKALTWLDTHGVAYTFHDYKKAGAPEAKVAAWVKAHGWERLVNRRGTTWRKLPEEERASMDAKRAVRAALDNPSILVRPIVEGPDGITTGFDPDLWGERFGS